METSKDCLFCDSPKTWHTNITIEGEGILDTVSICPKCRGTHIINDIFEKLIEGKIELLEKIVKGVKT